MGPGVPFRKLPQEHGRSADTPKPPACVGQVGCHALQAGLVLVVQRHVPDAFPTGLTRRLQARQQVLVSAEGSSRHAPPQRDHTCPGQSGQVDHRLGLKAIRIGQGIRQDQASLGVGVDDLDRLAVHGRDHIARLVRGSTGQVLRRWHKSHHMQGKPELGHGQHRPQHGRRAAHVAAHAVHLFRGL